MRRNFIMGLLLSCITIGFTTKPKESKWTQLFNGRTLAGWDTYLAPDMDDNGKAITKAPLGLNNDPRHVFIIVKEDGEPAIKVSGENWGAIITNKEFENYHLRLQFKWGKLLWGQKKKGNRKDSGLLYHSVGPYGADYGAWMRAQEFQIEESTCGDFWGCAGGTADIPVIKKDNNYFYSPQGIMTTFSEGNNQGRHCTKQGDSHEKPSGEWNTLDLYCHGDTSIHVVNGKVAMVLYHNSQNDKGMLSPMVKGKIQLQSEGAEVFYRKIEMQKIYRLPGALLKE
jgi:hypothetical protein